MQFRAVKGMNDILPGEVERWHQFERAFARCAELHGFKEVRTPIVEPTGLFVRSIGDTTDVVQKEMYSFTHHDDPLTLRPEGTASAVRAYVQHSVAASEPVTRWYYQGPMYRAERPQRGRYRQFFQAGCEIFGDPGPACDAELIALLVGLFQGLGISQLKVLVNSIGGPDSRARYRELLLEFLRPKAAELSAESQSRLEKNPLRVLDSKSPVDKQAVIGAPSTLDALTPEDRAHFDELCAQLSALQIPFEVSTSLVRGLDYYSRTLFEIQSDAGELGAQNTLVGGGRYDGLVKALGGPDVGSIGFAIGIERVLLALGGTALKSEPLVFVAPIGAEATRLGLHLAQQLRGLGIKTEIDGREGSLKSKLRRANGMGATLALVLGEQELAQKIVQLKHLALHTQQDVPLDRILEVVEQQMQSAQPVEVSP
jgi:histidyl-tRNA synthetase